MTKKIIIIVAVVFLLAGGVIFFVLNQAPKANAIVSVVATKDLPLYKNKPYDFNFRDYFQKPLVSMSDAQREKIIHAGKGFIFDERGLIFTAEHIVENTDDITVILSDGRELKAQLVQSNSDLDIAILGIHADNFQVLEFANRDLKVGDEVWGGEILALKQDLEVGEQKFTNLIETSVFLEEGDSGSPLLGTDYKILGLQVVLGSGGSFAVPLAQE